MNSKQNRKFNKYETISMLVFLKDFVGITEQLKTLKKATHKDIKFLKFEKVIAVPFECVDNDDLATGKILLVTDVKNHIAPYKNPLRMQEIKASSYKKTRKVRR